MSAETAVRIDAEGPEADPVAPRAVDWANPRVSAILTAAAKCFADKGFSSTTLAEIGKELGLRKSIVHYYFASKAALIHEVQSFTYHKYLDRVKDALASDLTGDRVSSALQSLWEAIQNNKTGTGLNIEVWSAARRDPELKRRAAALQADAHRLVNENIVQSLGFANGDAQRAEALSTLILAVLNGLSVTEYLEEDETKAKRAYEEFVRLLGQSHSSHSA
jgi:AcrR family transcriptional regulator